MDKFKNKYRIPSARLIGWDYTSEGAYFITICTDNREDFFGKCEKGKMKLSTIGAIVQGFWFEIPKHFAHVTLGEFTVMPNHIHGILHLDKMLPISESNDNDGIVETLQCNVSTGENNHTTDENYILHPAKNEFFQKISPKAGSVSVIIRSYKSICSTHIHAAFPDISFVWQERFWDNIIKSEESYNNISNYIINNPDNWENDKFFEP